jgi:hypothetical protein
MPIRKRLTNKPRRESELRNAKGRHPLLKTGSRHFNVWDVMLSFKEPITAEQISNRTTFFHPQILKDLLDAKLIKKVGKRGTEYLFVADPAGLGIIPREVRVQVELVEDEEGFFHAFAYVVGSTQKPKGGVRTLVKRGLNFIVPMEFELDDPRFSKAHPFAGDNVITGDATDIITDPSFMLIEG